MSALRDSFVSCQYGGTTNASYLPLVLFLKPIVLTIGDLVFIAIGTIYDIGSKFLSSTLPTFQKEIDERSEG